MLVTISRFRTCRPPVLLHLPSTEKSGHKLGPTRGLYQNMELTPHGTTSLGEEVEFPPGVEPVGGGDGGGRRFKYVASRRACEVVAERLKARAWRATR